MRTPNTQFGKIIFLALSIFAWHIGRAEFSTDLSNAAEPLTDGVPEVAVVRLRGLLNRNLSETEWRATVEKLAEALLAAEQPTETLQLLDDGRVRELSSSKFWRAQALASLHRPAEALSIYEQIAIDEKSSFHANAIFGAAEMLRALNRPGEALQKLAILFRDPIWSVQARLRSAELFLDQADAPNARRILDAAQPKSATDKKEREFLRGRLEMISQRPEGAAHVFQSLLQRPRGASHTVLLVALFGFADAHLQMKTPEAGDDLLEDFIEHHPQDIDLARVFAKLDELYQTERRPARNELERWIREGDQPRRAFAQWYLARLELRAGQRDRALQLFSAVRESKTKGAGLAGAFLEFAEIEMKDRNFDEAVVILTEARSLQPEKALRDRIDLLTAQAEYRGKRFEPAALNFEQIAHSPSPWAKSSIFNASLAWLQAGNHTRFLTDNGELEKSNGEEMGAELRLEEGLVQAAKGDKNAADSLRTFLRDSPNDKRASEAWVALAELAFHATPPRLDEARKDLARAAELKPTPAATERADSLLIWIEDAMGGNDAKVLELAKEFIERHPTSPVVGDVRLKLAEAYYRHQDFANAQTQFEILAEQNPSGPLAEKALFFAGESAMSSMVPQALDRAMGLFERVVRLNGELKWTARNEQAALERKAGKLQDAVALYEEVLKNDARPAEKMEALCGKGDVLFEMAGNDPKNYGRAIEVYDKLAAAAAEQIQWRNQALFKKGLCLEKQRNEGEALAAFYQVIDNEKRPNRPNELFWFYKAGFNAARLLEGDSKWQAAAAIYDRLVSAGGLRSEEAKARLNRLRLEHFLWED
jgi:outer membrane protein assembly factor BamD (BamD/ComL family)